MGGAGVRLRRFGELSPQILNTIQLSFFVCPLPICLGVVVDVCICSLWNRFQSRCYRLLLLRWLSLEFIGLFQSTIVEAGGLRWRFRLPACASSRVVRIGRERLPALIESLAFSQELFPLLLVITLCHLLVECAK